MATLVSCTDLDYKNFCALGKYSSFLTSFEVGPIWVVLLLLNLRTPCVSVSTSGKDGRFQPITKIGHTFTSTSLNLTNFFCTLEQRGFLLTRLPLIGSWSKSKKLAAKDSRKKSDVAWEEKGLVRSIWILKVSRRVKLWLLTRAGVGPG